jgi:hypothetical protein
LRANRYNNCDDRLGKQVMESEIERPHPCRKDIMDNDDRTNVQIENELAEEFLGRIFIGFLILVAAGLIIAAYFYL